MRILFLMVLVMAGSKANAAFCPPNTIQSPYMNMCVPVVGQDPGPDWANNINASLSIIDQHDHTPGHGNPVTPAGINITSDLPFLNNNATQLRSARFTSQVSPIAGASDLGAVYVSGVDLYYNDANGNQVRITQGGSVTGSSGTITGLPSGTASASFSGSTFTFNSATNTPANMKVGPVSIGTNTVSPKTVTLAPPGGLAANYNLTLPNGLPGSTSILSLDASGNMASVATTGSGNVVLSTAPTFSGDVQMPWLDLTTAGSSKNVITMNSNGTKYGNVQVSSTAGTGAWALGYSNSDTTTLGTAVLTWTGGGRVGIGSTAPADLLDVNGTADVHELNASNFVNISGGSSSGGNVPHNCAIQTAGPTVGSTLSKACASGGIAVGGGCNSNTGSIQSSYPSTSITWTCVNTNSGATMTVYAICCAY